MFGVRMEPKTLTFKRGRWLRQIFVHPCNRVINTRPPRLHLVQACSVLAHRHADRRNCALWLQFLQKHLLAGRCLSRGEENGGNVYKNNDCLSKSFSEASRPDSDQLRSTEWEQRHLEILEVFLSPLLASRCLSAGDQSPLAPPTSPSLDIKKARTLYFQKMDSRNC